MKLTYQLIITLLLLLPCGIHAQVNTFEGVVVNEQNSQPLDMAGITLLRADSSAIHFGYTEANGRFSLQSPQGQKTTYLLITYMGYEPLTLPVSRFKNGMEIRMKGKAFKLREVKVTSQRLTERKDTLVYNVSGFKMPQDRSIADVLKKMPGLEVRPDGNIRYQGKPINRFYIEGMNLLNEKYNLAGNNLAAKSVKEVQILRNHQPIKALKDIDFSDQAALNLVLQDDAKSQLIGSVDLGIGSSVQDHPEMLWNTRIIGMLFAPKQQNLSMYKNNNTGENIRSELTSHKIGIYRMGGVNEEFGFLSLNRESTGLAQERSLFNNAHLATTNHLWKPDKNNAFRIQLSYQHDEQRHANESDMLYKFPGQQTIVRENKQYNSLEDELEGEFTYTRDSESTYINNKTKAYALLARGNNSIITNDEHYRQQIKPKRQMYENNFELIKRGSNRSYSISSINSYSNMPQSLQVTPGINEDLLNEDKPYDNFLQNIHLQAFNSHTYTYFQHRIGHIFIRYKAGLQLRYQALNSDIELNEGNSATLIEDKRFVNKNRFMETTTYLEPSANYEEGDLRVNLVTRLSYKNLLLKDKIREPQKSTENHFLPEPSLYFSYKLNAYWKVAGNASYSHSFGDIHQLYSGYIFTSYRSASVFTNRISLDKRQNYGLSFEYANPLQVFFFNISGYHMPLEHNMLYDSKLNGILIQKEAVYMKTHARNSGVNFRINQGLGFWKTNLTLTGSYVNYEDKQLLNGELTPFTGNNIISSFSVTMQPNKYVNFEENSNYTYSKISSSSNIAPVHSFRHSLVCNILPSKNWQIKWNNIFYHSNDASIASTFFSDLSLTYTTKKWDAGISMQNIFNKHSYIQEYAGSMIESTYIYALRPREIIAKFTFSF